VDSPKRLGYVVACVLSATLVVSLGTSAGTAKVPHSAAGPAVRSAAAAPAPTSLLGTPTVPVSVTSTRSFTVTGDVLPGHAEQTVLACYRRVSGTWTRERTVVASVAPSAVAGRYSAAVSLSPAGIWAIRAESTRTAEPSFSATSSEIRVSDRADAIVWNRDGVLTAPERMAYRRDARQLIVVTAKSLKSRTGVMRLYEYRSGDWVMLVSSACRLGRNGLCAGPDRRRGNQKTPTGIWLMPGFVFGQHATKPSGTKLEYRHITKYHWWSAEKGSRYNTWVWSRRHVDGEHLIDYRKTYEYALSTGYNAKPNYSRYGRGTGIFLHVWEDPGTAGCVSVPRATMQQVFRTLDPAKRRVFVVGTTGVNDPTNVFVY
jgi:L,D-peptidoglycan transpeptidase YkuD (ErfK/YbiS/YcfS/YnhG family)